MQSCIFTWAESWERKGVLLVCFVSRKMKVVFLKKEKGFDFFFSFMRAYSPRQLMRDKTKERRNELSWPLDVLLCNIWAKKAKLNLVMKKLRQT